MVEPMNRIRPILASSVNDPTLTALAADLQITEQETRDALAVFGAAAYTNPDGVECVHRHHAVVLTGA